MEKERNLDCTLLIVFFMDHLGQELKNLQVSLNRFNKLAIIFLDYPLPEPVIFKEKINFFNWNLLCFWQKEVNEGAHDDNQATKDQENSEFEMTERGEESLCY